MKGKMFATVGICLPIIMLAIGFFPKPAKAIELSLGSFTPAAHAQSAVLEEWIKRVHKATNGTLKITHYPASALAGPTEDTAALKNGVVDIYFGCPNYHPGEFPLTSIIVLPSGISSVNQSTRVSYELGKGGLASEYKDFHLIALHSVGPTMLHTVNKPVRKLEDAKGLEIRSGGDIGPVLKKLGMVPVSMPQPEAYLALKRGVVDGILVNWEAMYGFKHGEACKYSTILNLNVSPFYLLMNLGKWNSLTRDQQKAIDGLEEWYVSEFIRVWHKIDMEGKAYCEKLGNEIITLPPRELQKWYDVVEPYKQEWIAQMEAKGLPGKKVYNERLKLIQKYKD